MDVISRFIEDECYINPKSNANAKELYTKYKTWADDNTEYKLRKNKFEEELDKKGYKKAILNGQNVFTGIAIRD